MLQSEKTPKRSSATIRKDLAEKAAAEVKAKGGEVGKSFEKQLKRATEENPAVLNKIKKSPLRQLLASRIQQLESDLKTANQRATDAETAKKEAEEAQRKADESAKKAGEALKKAQTDLGTLKGVSEENTKLKTKVQRLEKESAQAHINFAATLEAEQNRLVAKSDADNDARMKIAWALAHRYVEDVVYLREQGEPEPASVEAWVNSNNELPAPELPGPGEAQEIPSDDEKDQEAPSAGQK
ncbi:uncharacterized protein LOC110704184 [Chenopodium quinoa]|uniref:uncharacterized protein LOC110704184 n=1 Tax=Chenopodium quinoa TaxID=63459 RepID=UPI000B795BB1|nr:uncharacterized protein LOC110704184 [Chenopodium quinoa]